MSSTITDVEVEVPKVELTDKEKKYVEDWTSHPMRKPRLAKVVINFAVGKSGEPLERARKLCELLTQQTPKEGRAKITIKGFGIRKNEPISVYTTLRGEKAIKFLKKALWAVDFTVKRKNFDQHGNLSFGIVEHLNLPGLKYDPSIGVYGFDVTAVIQRPGFRIKYRRKQRRKLPTRQKIFKEEGIAYFKHEFGVTVTD